MEELCPQAWFVNYTNPMMRVCDAIQRYSRIKSIGLCHQIFYGYYMVGYLLSDYLNIDVPAYDFPHAKLSLEFNAMQDLIVKQTTPKIEIQAAGFESFHLDAGGA